MRALPGQPVRGPLRVRRLNRLRAERKGGAEPLIEQREFVGQQSASGSRERLPDEQRTRIGSRLLRRGREHREDGERGAARRLVPRAVHLLENQRGGVPRHGRNDQRGDDSQYFKTVWTCSPTSFDRPSSATSSMRNASAWT